MTQSCEKALLAVPESDDDHEFYCMICLHNVSNWGNGGGGSWPDFGSMRQFALEQCFQITDDGIVYDELGR